MSYACLATIAEIWCWPCPSRGVPENVVITMCGLNARITVITSLSSESWGQCFRVSSAVFENPKS